MSCCRTLFSVGLQREERHIICYLLFLFVLVIEEYEHDDNDTVIETEEFDIKTEK